MTQAADVAETTLKIFLRTRIAIVGIEKKNILELSSNKRTSKTDKFWINFYLKSFSRADKYEFVNGSGQLMTLTFPPR